MRIVHFPPMSGQEVSRLMGLAYQGGKHVEEDFVGYEEVEGVRIEVPPLKPGRDEKVGKELDEETQTEDERWRKICVDGTIVELESGGWVEVRMLNCEDRILVSFSFDGSTEVVLDNAYYG